MKCLCWRLTRWKHDYCVCNWTSVFILVWMLFALLECKWVSLFEAKQNINIRVTNIAYSCTCNGFTKSIAVLLPSALSSDVTDSTRTNIAFYTDFIRPKLCPRWPSYDRTRPVCNSVSDLLVLIDANDRDHPRINTAVVTMTSVNLYLINGQPRTDGQRNQRWHHLGRK